MIISTAYSNQELGAIIRQAAMQKLVNEKRFSSEDMIVNCIIIMTPSYGCEVNFTVESKNKSLHLVEK